MKKKTTTKNASKTAPKAKSTRTTKRAAKGNRPRATAKRAAPSPAATVIAPDFDRKEFEKAVAGTKPLKAPASKRRARPPKRATLRIVRTAATTLGKIASKISRAIGAKK